MKQKSNWLWRTLLIAGILCGLTTVSFAQAERTDSKRKTTTVKRNSESKKQEARSQKREVKREARSQKREVKREARSQKREVKRDARSQKRAIKRDARSEKRAIKRDARSEKREVKRDVRRENRAEKKRIEEKKRSERSRVVVRNGNRGNRGNGNNGRVNNGRNRNRGNDNNVNVSDYRNNNQQPTQIRRRFTQRHHDRINRYRYNTRVDAHIYLGRHHRHSRHPYWRKYKRPRKLYYARYGWSPFFHLDIRPTIRFSTYTRPLIRRKTNIVFTKEYDLYDYRPGDAIGYSVHINFNGKVKVYDRYYDEDPVLAETFYIGDRKLRKLNRILRKGDYYRDGHCLLDSYGDDDHRGYATIAFRSSPNRSMRSVSLNLAAPEEYYPRYMKKFMNEIEDILFENDDDYWD